MHADGAKATGFKSMVVAQFTAVSLQKDDRAFVKYDKSHRSYEGLNVTLVRGSTLSTQSSSTDSATVYHLDSDAVYREGWGTTHIKMDNDAIMQIVSVFAIGYQQHFDANAGGDASVTNSNSNFGQISLSSKGFKKAAFVKDNNAFVTSIITPRAITGCDTNIDFNHLMLVLRLLLVFQVIFTSLDLQIRMIHLQHQYKVIELVLDRTINFCKNCIK